MIACSYQYDPDMVFAHYPLSSGLISECGAAALLHHLSALARGKLVVVFEAENGINFPNPQINCNCIKNFASQETSYLTIVRWYVKQRRLSANSPSRCQNLTTLSAEILSKYCAY